MATSAVTTDLTVLTTAQFVALGSAQIAGLTTQQVASLRTDFAKLLASSQVAALDTTQVAALQAQSLAAFGTQQIAALNAADMAALNTTQLVAMTSGQFAAINIPQLAALSTGQIAALEGVDLAALSSAVFKTLSLQQTAALSTSQIAALRADQRAVLKTVIDGISTSQFAKLTTSQIAALNTDQVAKLSSEYVRALTTAQIGAFEREDLQALSTSSIAALQTSVIAAMGTAALRTLSYEQAKAFSDQQVASLREDQKKEVNVRATTDLSALTTAQFAALTPAQIKGLTTQQVSTLRTDFVRALTTTQVPAIQTEDLVFLATSSLQLLSPSQIGALTPAEIAALTLAQISALMTGQVQAVSSAGIAAITVAEMVAMTTAQVSALTTAQVQALSTRNVAAMESGDLRAMTTAQIAALTTGQVVGLVSERLDASIMVGGYLSGSTDGQFVNGVTLGFISRYTENGARIWTNSLEGTGNDFVSSMALNPDGSVLVGGQTYRNLGVYTNLGDADGFLANFSKDGAQIWVQLIGTPAADSVNVVASSGADTFVASGNTYGGPYGHRNGDVFVAKFDVNENRQWIQVLGGSGNENVTATVVSQDGSVLVGGGTRWSFDDQTSHGGSDGFILKFASDGSKLWTRLIGTSGDDQVSWLTTEEDGSFMAAGFTSGDLDGEHSHGWEDGFITKYSSDGTRLWTHLIGEAAQEKIVSVQTTIDKSFLVVGNATGGLDGQIRQGGWDGFISKYGSDGSLIWTRLIAGKQDEWVTSSSVEADGSVTVGGWTSSLTLDGQPNSGTRDGFLTKYASDGTLLWTQLIGGPGYDAVTSITAGAELGGMRGLDMLASQIMALTVSQINAIGEVGRMAAFSIDQVAALTTVQISGLSTASASGLSAAQFAVLSTAQVIAITTANVAALTTAEVVALTVPQLAVFSAAQVAAINAPGIAAMQTADLVALSTGQMAALTARQINALQAPQVAALSAAQVAGLSAAQFAALNTAALNILNTTQFAALTTAQAAALTTLQVANLESADFAALGTAQIAVLSTADMAVLSRAVMVATSTAQVIALSTAQVQAISTQSLAGMERVDLQAMTTAQVAALTNAQVVGLAQASYSLYGSVVVGGYTYGSLDGLSNNSGDGFVSKYRADGTRLWTKLVGDSGYEEISSLAINSDSSVVAGGYTTGNVDGQANRGGWDGFLTKYGADGTRIWTRLLGTPGEDLVYAATAAGEGAVVVGGYTKGNLDGETNRGGLSDGFLTKYSSDGGRLWTRLLGGVGWDFVNAVASNSDGSVVAVGITDGNLDDQTNHGGWDGFLTKYSADGRLLWTSLLGSISEDRITSVTANNDGSVVVGGYTFGVLDGPVGNGGKDAFVAKFSSDGTRLWTKQIGGSGDDQITSVTTTIDGSVLVGGTTWGAVDGYASVGGTDGFLSKYSADGKLLWTTLTGGNAYDGITSVKSNLDGSVLVGGYTNGNLDGQPPTGGWDGFISMYSADGIRLWTRLAGGSGYDGITSVGTYNDGTVPFTTTQTAALTPAQINALGAANLMSGFATDQVAALTTAQISAFSTASASGLSAAQFALLSTAQVVAITTANVAALSTSEVVALTLAQVAVLATAQVAAINTAGIASMETADLVTLSASQFAALSARQINALQAWQVAALSTAQIAGLSTTQIAALATGSLNALSTAQLQLLSTAQVRAFTLDQVANLEISDFAALNTAQVSALGTAGIAAITTAQAAALSTAQVAQGLTTAQVAALENRDLLALRADSLRALQAGQVGALRADQLNALGTVTQRSGATMGDAAWTAADLRINGVAVDAAGSAKDLADAINSKASITGVVASARATVSSGASLVPDDGKEALSPVSRQPVKRFTENGHFYQIVADSSLTPVATQSVAETYSYRGLQGYLATITSAAENAFVKDLTATSPTGNAVLLFGASDAEVDGNWKWVSGPEKGAALNYFAWGGGEPNGYYGAFREDYTAFAPVSGTWVDLPAYPYAAGYIVEYGGMPSTYTLTGNASSVNEGAKVSFSVATTNVQWDSMLQYTISGVTAADVVGGSLTGTAKVGSDGIARFDVGLVADGVAEASETMTVTVAGQSTSVTVNDGSDPRECAPTTVVSVSVKPQMVAETSTSRLVYTFTRTGDTSSALTVNVGMGGTATGGDYTSSPVLNAGSSAQPTQAWTRLLGTESFDSAGTITLGLDGSVYLGGVSGGAVDGNTSRGNADGFVTRYSADGTKLWTRTVASTKDDQVHDLATGLDGSIYAAGMVNGPLWRNGDWSSEIGTLDGQTYQGLADGFVTKFNSDGTKAWTRLQGTGGQEVSYSISVGADGSAYAIGFTEGKLAGQTNAGARDVNRPGFGGGQLV